ncbi:MAG TPA: PRC-barrel domain-containing protein [Armatimonadota bacterium]|nr:PRC-barrel domain-containing protein [Armatimonadota bacterium]
MNAQELVNAKVLDIGSGTTVGSVTGVLIDPQERKVVALRVDGGFLARPHYLAFENIVSAENDVVTIPTRESLVQRGSFRAIGMIDGLTGREVFTEDGMDLGTVQDYTVEPITGEIHSITFAVDKERLGGLWHATGDSYNLPITLVKTLGENVIVDNSVPDEVGLKKAA